MTNKKQKTKKMETTTTPRKIKDNLYLVGNKVMSYETFVAEIRDGKLFENGKYSKTTSRHIKHIAEIFELTIVPSSEKPSFNKLPYRN